jgi:hypothetical protein
MIVLLFSQFSFSSAITCEQATGLNGDLFTTQQTIQPPSTCISLDCQQGSLRKIQDAVRKNTQPMTVTMKFTNDETHNVRLAFCSFSTSGIMQQFVSFLFFILT